MEFTPSQGVCPNLIWFHIHNNLPQISFSIRPIFWTPLASAPTHRNLRHMTTNGATSDPKTPPPPSPTANTNYHPALSVSNIKNNIPLVLDREKVQYSNWVELFEIQCHAHDVLDHIDSTNFVPLI